MCDFICCGKVNKILCDVNEFVMEVMMIGLFGIV